MDTGGPTPTILKGLGLVRCIAEADLSPTFLCQMSFQAYQLCLQPRTWLVTSGSPSPTALRLQGARNAPMALPWLMDWAADPKGKWLLPVCKYHKLYLSAHSRTTFLKNFTWTLQNVCASAAIIAACAICFIHITYHAVNDVSESELQHADRKLLHMCLSVIFKSLFSF